MKIKRTLSKIKRDIAEEFRVPARSLKVLFDSGIVSKGGVHRNVHIRHPQNERMMIAATIEADGSAKVATCWNIH